MHDQERPKKPDRPVFSAIVSTAAEVSAVSFGNTGEKLTQAIEYRMLWFFHPFFLYLSFTIIKLQYRQQDHQVFDTTHYLIRLRPIDIIPRLEQITNITQIRPILFRKRPIIQEEHGLTRRDQLEQ